MLGWLLQRVAQALLVIFAMSLVVFLGLHAVGNPADLLLAPDATQIDRAELDADVLAGAIGHHGSLIVRNLAIEMGRSHPRTIVAGLHPGTVNTGLSEPFQRGVAAEKLFSPAVSAEYLLGVLDGLTAADSGGVFAWDGARIPA